MLREVSGYYLSDLSEYRLRDYSEHLLRDVSELIVQSQPFLSGKPSFCSKPCKNRLTIAQICREY